MDSSVVKDTQLWCQYMLVHCKAGYMLADSMSVQSMTASDQCTSSLRVCCMYDLSCNCCRAKHLP